MSALLSDMIGFGLVVFASAGICAALNVQKYVHIKNTDPSTGQPMVSFMEIPLWWVGTIGNLVAEIMNLAALGYAPATLVTPLGCLTVVFNAVAAHLLLGEPFLRQDAIGITFIIVGVVCVVFSQVGEPQPPITPTCVQTPPGQTCTGLSEVVVSGGFWILIAIVVVGLFLMYRYVHEQYCQKYAWVYLVESSLVSSLGARRRRLERWWQHGSRLLPLQLARRLRDPRVPCGLCRRIVKLLVMIEAGKALLKTTLVVTERGFGSLQGACCALHLVIVQLRHRQRHLRRLRLRRPHATKPRNQSRLQRRANRFIRRRRLRLC
jgi:uncharacterized membrane protein